MPYSADRTQRPSGRNELERQGLCDGQRIQGRMWEQMALEGARARWSVAV